MNTKKKSHLGSLRILSVVLMSLLLICSPLGNIMPEGAAITAEAATKTSLNKTSIKINAGKKYVLKMTGVKSGAKVKWSTSNKKLAAISVSKDGTQCTVTAKKKGTAYITATIEKKKYKCKVTVYKKPELSATSQSINVGKAFELSFLNGSGTPKWSVSDKKILKIKKINKNKYKVTGLKAGTSYVNVKVKGKKYKCKVTVKTPKPALSASSVTVNYGGTKSISLKNAAKSVKWSAADKKIITIKANGSACKITGARVGETKLTASYGGKKYTCKVTVKKISAPVINNGEKTLNILDGKSAAVQVSGNKESAKEWASANPNVATVTEKGVVTGHSAGTAAISCVADGVQLSLKVIVTAGETSVPDTPQTDSEATPSDPRPSQPSQAETSVPETQPDAGVTSDTKLSDTTLSLMVSGSAPLILKNISADANISWASSNTSVAQIERGFANNRCVITGIAPGTANVSASVEGKNFVCAVTVTAVGGTKPSQTETNPPEAEPQPVQTEAPVTQPETQLPQTEAPAQTETSTTVTASGYYYDLASWRNSESLPGGDKSALEFDTNYPIDRISTTLSNDNVELEYAHINTYANGSGKTYLSVGVVGRKAGTTTVTVAIDGKTVATSTITVTSDDTLHASYVAWKNSVKSQIWTESMSLKDKLFAVGTYILNNYDYEEKCPASGYPFANGYGGNCNDSAGLIIDFAKDLGLPGRFQQWTRNPGHVGAVITIDGVEWLYDFSATGTAGNRGTGLCVKWDASQFGTASF